MDSFTFQAINFAYHFALAAIVGGGLVLGAAVAPALFRGLPSRGQAGALFGDILARYDGVALVSAALALLTAWLRAVNFETPDERHWIRFGALALMAGAVVYGSAYANPVARQFRRQMPGYDDLHEAHPARREFARLHGASRRASALAVIAGVVAMLLS